VILRSGAGGSLVEGGIAEAAIVCDFSVDLRYRGKSHTSRALEACDGRNRLFTRT